MINILADLHNHSDFCDGLCSPAAMAAAALERGFTDFGFSGHSPAPFDLPCSLRDEAGYVAEIRRLQTEYAGKLRIYCGVEQDFCAPVADRSQYDYLIGGVHYLREAEDIYYAVDGSAEENARCIAQACGGDPYVFCRRYYAQVAENALLYQPELVAHFDLLVKNNADGRFFNEDDRRYRGYALEALEVCLERELILELNSGGMFRGYRRDPYPADLILKELLRRGGRLALSADAHETAAIGYGFDELIERLRCLGFRSLWQWREGRFTESGIC